MRAYGLDRDFEAALPRWLDEQGEVLVLHELGEYRAGRWLDPDWAAMRLALPRAAPTCTRARVRDHLADLGVTLPALLDRRADASIHVWFANYDGVRELLFPSLAHAYAQWREGDGGAALRRAIAERRARISTASRSGCWPATRAEAMTAGAAVERLLTAGDAVCPG